MEANGTPVYTNSKFAAKYAVFVQLGYIFYNGQI